MPPRRRRQRVTTAFGVAGLFSGLLVALTLAPSAALKVFRRAWFSITVGLLCMALAGCWTQFRHDAAHSGNQNLEFGISRANVGTLVQAWSATTGGSVSSSPAVANGVVYVGSNDHNLYAFDAAGVTNCSGTPTTCAPLWSATTGGSMLCSAPVSTAVTYGAWTASSAS